MCLITKVYFLFKICIYIKKCHTIWVVDPADYPRSKILWNIKKILTICLAILLLKYFTQFKKKVMKI